MFEHRLVPFLMGSLLCCAPLLPTASAATPVTKADIDPYINSITGTDVGKNGAAYAKFIDDAGWLSKFNPTTGRFGDVSYKMPFTGTVFDAPLPTTTLATENDDCIQHLRRLDSISIALHRSGWSDAATKTKATQVLVAGMDYWARINPFSWYDAAGKPRYSFSPSSPPAGSFAKLMGQTSNVRNVLLACGPHTGAGGFATTAMLQRWAVAIEDTTEGADFAGWSNCGTYDNGVNWWWRLQARIVRDWALGLYARADGLLMAARDSVKITLVPPGKSNYWNSGLRPDGTWNQHGIPYNGQYGKGGYDEMAKFGGAVVGMKYDIGAAGWQLLADYALDGTSRLTYRGIYSPDVLGRYFTQRYFGGAYGNAAGASVYGQALHDLKSHGYRVADLVADSIWAVGGAFPWPAQPSKVFPFGDAASWLRSDAAVFWKGTSKRLTRTESYDNGEDAGNPLVFDMGMGTHWILAHDGKQYFGNFMAVMDPSLLPGVTSDSFDIPPSFGQAGLLQTGGGRIYGTTSFVGGVGDGRYAALANDYDLAFHNGATDIGKFVGNKAVFFLDSAVVSLAAGMKWPDKSTSVRTGLNQLNRRGDFLVARATATQPASLALGNSQAVGKDIRWAWHDSVGYVLPPQGISVTASSQIRSESPGRAGLIKKVSHANVIDTVASVWLTHGKTNANRTAGDAFWYAFYPGISRAAFANLADNARQQKYWTVDANTDSVQAVSVPARNWHGLVFHEADTATLKSGLQVGATRPCALMLRTTADSLLLWIADPAQATAPISVVVGLALKGVGYDAIRKLSTVTVTLSTKPDSVGVTQRRAWALPPTSLAGSRPSAKPMARLLPGLGIFVTAPTGLYHITAHDLSGRQAGSWPVSVGESGSALIALREDVSRRWVLEVSR